MHKKSSVPISMATLHVTSHFSTSTAVEVIKAARRASPQTDYKVMSLGT